MAKIDVTKYNAQVANAASQVKISSTVFKDFIADVKAVVDGNDNEFIAHKADAAPHANSNLLKGDGERIEKGEDNTDSIATKFTSKAITFATAYASVPTVIVNGKGSSDDYYFKAQSQTTTGFTAVGIESSGGAAVTGIGFSWIAIGK